MKKQTLLYVVCLIIIIIAVVIYVDRREINKPGTAYPVQENNPTNSNGTITENTQNQINSNNTTKGDQYSPSQSSAVQYGLVTKDGDQPLNSPSITSFKITSPDNNTSWKIGSTQAVKWDLIGTVSPKSKYAVYLGNDIIAETNSSSTGKYSFIIPKTTMRGGSIVTIEPGTYKMHLAIFDGNISSYPNSPLGKLVSRSSNEITIQITK